ncbi:MAG: BACON domain-containing protein [Bacteroidales bacterium]|nr:BACON domain-containing protein [Bacteroidales bacterium]
MKNIYKYICILFACIAAMPSCQDKFEEEYEVLALDYDKIDVKHEGGKYTFMVYCSGDWTITLDKEVDWVTFDKTYGHGVTMVNIEFGRNEALKRSFTMTVSDGVETKTIPVVQVSPITKVVMEFLNQEGIDLADCAGTVVAKLKSNLPPSFIETLVPQTDSKWIEDCQIGNGSGEDEFVYDISFKVPANDTGAERKATVSLQFTDPDDVEYKAELIVSQSNEPGRLILDDSVVYGPEEKECFEVVKGGLLNFAGISEKVECIVSNEEFVKDVRVDGGMLCYTLLENLTDASREVEITLVYEGTTAKIKIVQMDAGVRSIIEIATAEDLLAWNEDVASWRPEDRVFLKSDIDCKGVITSANWTPNQFSGVFHGNGKTIDNFVIEKEGHAAFFRKLQGAAVQDLTFGEGCSFTSTAPVGDVVYAASLAGEVRGGVTITNVTNYGNVRISQNATSGAKGDYLGGICAYFLADSDSRMSGCRNYGYLTYSAKAAGTVYCGGIAALAATKVGLTMSGCENQGTVLFDGVNDTKVDVNLGGIAAIANTVNFDSCVNLGTVKSCTSTTVTGATNIGGIVGFMNNACGTITGCVNGEAGSAKGALTNESSASGVVRIGGFVGSIISKPINVTGFKNYGPVTNSGAVSNWTALGGVVGNIGGIADVNTVSGCENHGDVVNTKVVSRVSLGGVVGMIQKANTVVTGNSNAGKVTNTGDAPAGNGVTLGGIVGRIEAATNGENTIKDNTNSGDVIFDAAGAEDGTMLSGVAGILGGHAGNIADKVYQPCKLTIDNCSNSGKVEKTGAGASRMYVGGIAAFLNGLENNDTYVSDVSGCTNNGAVLNGSSGAGEWSIFTGGIVGYYRVNGTLKGCVNNGSVTNTSSAQFKNSFKHFRLGGIVGSAENGTITDCTNNGEVKDASETNAGCVGGIVGYAPTKAITLTNCDNKNSVTVSFNSAADPYPMAIGGVLGYADEAVTLDGCDNTGDVTNDRTTTALNIYMGGLVGQMPNKSLVVKNCTMSGTLTNNASGGKATLGAVVGICYDNTISDTHSTMAVNNTYANQYIGGFIGQVEANKTTDISNCSVNAAVVSKGAGYSGMFVGRLTDQTKDGKITTTLSNIWVKGSFEGTDLTADNYKGMCFGTGSDYKVTDSIQFGDFK